MGSAEQDEVGEVGGAAKEPVAQMVGFAPGQGAGAVGKDAAAVPHTQCPTLAGLDDSAAAPNVQGLAGGPT